APDKVNKGTILQMTTTAENSTTTLQFNYAENFGDGRGITFGIIGFTTGTYDGNELIKHYTTLNSNNNLARFIPALDAIDRLPHTGNDGDSNNSTAGLDGFIQAVQGNTDPLFRKAQLDKLDQLYWNPAVKLQSSIGAKNALTQAFLYDMTVNHGYSGAQNFISKATYALGGTPGTGIDENTYLRKLMELRETYLKNTGNPGADRVAAFKRILDTGNVRLITPFNFTVYGDTFKIDGDIQ
ncbi:MAG TPA: chitosanase, partial [Clostridiaceae bacterium]|nr:chitosanase [Clostridiaceae bacterium]